LRRHVGAARVDLELGADGHDALDLPLPARARGIGPAPDVDRRAVAGTGCDHVVIDPTPDDHIAGIAQRSGADRLHVDAVHGQRHRGTGVEGGGAGAGRARGAGRTGGTCRTGGSRRAGRAGGPRAADGERVFVALALPVAGGDGEQVIAGRRQAAGAREVAGDGLRVAAERRRAQRRDVADLAQRHRELRRRPEVVAGDDDRRRAVVDGDLGDAEVTAGRAGGEGGAGGGDEDEQRDGQDRTPLEHGGLLCEVGWTAYYSPARKGTPVRISARGTERAPAPPYRSRRYFFVTSW